MPNTWSRAPLGACVALAVGGAAAAANEARGQEEYMAHCAVCHGEAGQGDGPFAVLLTIQPADLTQLSAENGGRFPFERAYRIIDGRAPIAGHGPSAMPIWGHEYNAEAREYYMRSPLTVDPENYVTGRILALIRYLETIQR